MTDAPPIDYAASDLAPPADRLLRRIVAGVAIAYGVKPIVTTVLYAALAQGWVASPSSTAYGYNGASDIAFAVANVAVGSAMLIGGVLLLRRSAAGVVLLRAAVACVILLAIGQTVMLMVLNPTWASYWSTPATATLQGLNVASALLPVITIALLTLPPLAKRMA